MKINSIIKVGYGFSKKYNSKYWIIRNSWGPSNLKIMKF